MANNLLIFNPTVVLTLVIFKPNQTSGDREMKLEHILRLRRGQEFSTVVKTSSGTHFGEPDSSSSSASDLASY